jgi:hypothetical protein
VARAWIKSNDDDDMFDYIRLCGELDLVTHLGRQAAEAMWAQRQWIIDEIYSGNLTYDIVPSQYVGKNTKIIGRVYLSHLPAGMLGALDRLHPKDGRGGR